MEEGEGNLRNVSERKPSCVFCCTRISKRDQSKVGSENGRICTEISNILGVKREKWKAVTGKNRAKRLKMCKRCSKIGRDVCLLHLQIKALELRLNGKLEELNKILKSTLQLNQREGEKVKKEEVQFRGEFITKCSARTKCSFPQLKLHRVDQQAMKRKCSENSNLQRKESKFSQSSENDYGPAEPDRPIIVMTDFIDVSEDEADYEIHNVTLDQPSTPEVAFSNCEADHYCNKEIVVLETGADNSAKPNPSISVVNLADVDEVADGKYPNSDIPNSGETSKDSSQKQEMVNSTKVVMVPQVKMLEDLSVRPKRAKNSCSQCPKTFSTSAGLERHLEEAHNKNNYGKDGNTGSDGDEPSALSDSDRSFPSCQEDASSSESDYLDDDDNTNMDELREDDEDEAKVKAHLPQRLVNEAKNSERKRKRNSNNAKSQFPIILKEFGRLARESKYLSPEMEGYCEVCMNNCGSRLALEKHRVVVHKCTHFVHCPACGKYLSDRDRVKIHLERRRCKLPAKMKVAPTILEAAVQEPRIRYPRLNFQRGKLFCTEEGCHEVFQFKTYLNIHSRTHGNWTCSATTCKETFTKAHELAVHESRCHIFETTWRSAKIGPDCEFSCSRCRYSSPSITRYLTHFLGKHLGLIISDYEEGLKCPICSRTFANNKKATLEIHMRTQHGSENDQRTVLKCKMCEVTFRDPQPLYQHMLIVHKIKDSFECTHCDKKFSKLSRLKLHVKSAHKALIPTIPEYYMHECTICKETFMTESALKTHNKAHESRDDWLPCDMCTRKFKKKADLDMHIKIHTVIKQPHICKQCGKSFKDKCDLTQHMFVHESPEKWKHVCTEEGCGKRFYYRTKLTEHMRTHTNEKPFVCDTCGKKYSHRHNLRIHVKNHHGESAAAALIVKKYGQPFHKSSQDPEASAK